jgi:hypothetical protein
MVMTSRSFDVFRNMKALQVIGEIMNGAFKWHMFPVSLKTEVVLLYFKGLSLRALIKYKTTNYPLEEREGMWVEAIDKLLKDESLRKNYSEKAKQRAEGSSRLEGDLEMNSLLEGLKSRQRKNLCCGAWVCGFTFGG